MAGSDEIKEAIACLSNVYPQYVSKTLADLTDQIESVVQSYTDPMAAIDDLSVDSLVESVAESASADTFGNLEEIATGLLSQYVKRDASSFSESLPKEFSNVTKKVQDIRNMSGRVIQTASQMLSLFPDMPYVAAQKMCESMIRVIDMKVCNLRCLRKHIVQLTNCVLVLVNHVDDYHEQTLYEITLASEAIDEVETELVKSQRLDIDNNITFDSQAFERARQAMLNAVSHLTPEQDGDNILAEADLMTPGGIQTTQITKSNRSLVTMAIPQLVKLIEVESAAVNSQISVINYHANALTAVINQFRIAGKSSRVQTMRARAITDIRNKVARLGSRIDVALTRGSTRTLAEEMLSWASGAKTIVAAMDRVKTLTLQEGSIEGIDKAYELQVALEKLLNGLISISGISYPTAENGIEDSTEITHRVTALAKGAFRILGDLENNTTSENRIATFHLLSLQTATLQVNTIDDSITVALEQRALCEEFAAINLQVRERYDELLGSMRQLGLDRAVDLLSVGKFDDFLSSDLDDLSYLGVGISCLTHALGAVDDTQTRGELISIRDEMISRQTNQEVAAADSVDQGRVRILTDVKSEVSSIQKNAKVIESILAQLTGTADKLNIDIDVDMGGTPAFLGNLDYLSVGAGGRLSGGLEEISEYANAGVVSCKPL